MAGWGSPGKSLPLGKHVAQIRDVEKTTGKDFKDPSKTNPQFKWGVDYWDGQKWVAHAIYTGQNFTDMSTIKDPKFVPKLCLLVLACDEPLPKSAEEAAAWDEQSLIGKKFVIEVSEDEVLGTTQIRYLKYRPQPAPEAPAQSAPPQSAPPAEAREPALAGAGAPGRPDPWS